MPAIFLLSFKRLITFRIPHHLILIQGKCWKNLNLSPKDSTRCLINIPSLLLITRYAADAHVCYASFNPLSGSTPRGVHQGELPLKGLIHNLEEVWVGFTTGGVLPSAYLYSNVDTVSNRFKNENEYGKKS